MTAQIETLKESLAISKADLKSTTNRIGEVNNLIQECSKDLHIITKANEYFDKAIDFKVNDVRSKIEDIINSGLKSIFEADIRIKIDSTIKRNKTEFSINVVYNGVEGVKEAFGGGVLAVVSFLLKVTVNLLMGRYKFMIFDESTAFVSIEYQENLSSFIRQLCDKMGFNITLITHQPKLATSSNRVYKVSQKDGVSKYTVQEND